MFQDVVWRLQEFERMISNELDSSFAEDIPILRDQPKNCRGSQTFSLQQLMLLKRLHQKITYFYKSHVIRETRFSLES